MGAINQHQMVGSWFMALKFRHEWIPLTFTVYGEDAGCWHPTSCPQGYSRSQMVLSQNLEAETPQVYHHFPSCSMFFPWRFHQFPQDCWGADSSRQPGLLSSPMVRWQPVRSWDMLDLGLKDGISINNNNMFQTTNQNSVDDGISDIGSVKPTSSMF